jgi:hypothetical protein
MDADYGSRSCGQMSEKRLIPLSRDPIGLGKFDAPEARRRGEKFDADTATLVAIVAEEDHAALQLVLSEGIGKHQDGSEFEILGKVQQPAMSIDDDGFGGLAEAAALLVLASELHANAREDARTAAFAFVNESGHDPFMVG